MSLMSFIAVDQCALCFMFKSAALQVCLAGGTCGLSGSCLNSIWNWKCCCKFQWKIEKPLILKCEITQLQLSIFSVWFTALIKLWKLIFFSTSEMWQKLCARNSFYKSEVKLNTYTLIRFWGNSLIKIRKLGALLRLTSNSEYSSSTKI